MKAGRKFQPVHIQLPQCRDADRLCCSSHLQTTAGFCLFTSRRLPSGSPDGTDLKNLWVYFQMLLTCTNRDLFATISSIKATKCLWKGVPLSLLEPQWPLYLNGNKATSQRDKPKERQADEGTGNRFIGRPPAAADGGCVMWPLCHQCDGSFWQLWRTAHKSQVCHLIQSALNRVSICAIKKRNQQWPCFYTLYHQSNSKWSYIAFQYFS